jgi:hypothetical protein
VSTPEYWKKERVAAWTNLLTCAIIAVVGCFAIDACRRNGESEHRMVPAAIQACRATCAPGPVHEAATDFCECK